MINIRQCGPTGGDCTAPYDVIMDRPYTVREFVDEIVGDGTNQNWGKICIDDDERPWSAHVVCWYKNRPGVGGIEGEYDPSYDDMQVISARMSGGWSCYDWYLKVGEAG